uniref:Uncharacterized protein n=1 Tax=Anguilla anguilla TaxID=7936 RepID=A0A0E9W7W4_ANGAN
MSPPTQHYLVICICPYTVACSSA